MYKSNNKDNVVVSILYISKRGFFIKVDQYLNKKIPLINGESSYSNLPSTRAGAEVSCCIVVSLMNVLQYFNPY